MSCAVYRTIFNWLLRISTSNFEKGDALDHWVAIHQRLHCDTITFLPHRAGRPVPNLEHMILHALTLVTALLTLMAYLGG